VLVRRLGFVCLVLLAVSLAGDSLAAPAPAHGLEDYRQFRAIAIDLLGRMPNRSELAEFERPGFDLEAFIDKHLSDATYAKRMTRVYMDLLRLEPNLPLVGVPYQLPRFELVGPDGPVYIYWRPGQRRAREDTDAEFCLSSDDTGQIIRFNAPILGTPKKVSKEALDRATVVVKPWWLYRDYASPNPHERYGEDWKPDRLYQPANSLLKEPDGKPTAEVRVCREEAQAAETGHVYASGRKPGQPWKNPKPNDLPGGGRYRPPPVDPAYATAHKGDKLSCATRLALSTSADCGCGAGLERCLPYDGNGAGSVAFLVPNRDPLGADLPLDNLPQAAQRWFPFWWSQEAVHFLDALFAQDRDFREILTSRATFVNGPLAHYYSMIQKNNCCDAEVAYGMTEETEPLFDPSRVPAGLMPYDVSTWKPVPDRGPHAAGIATMPIFLEKFASARSRAAALTTTFLCHSFVAENAVLTPSTDPNLMERPGCSTCHGTLEPLAAYFTRIEPGGDTYLPPSLFPTRDAGCKKDAKGKISGSCNTFYDIAFADETGALLRSAYGSPEHADAAATGLAHDFAAKPEFASCAVDHVASSLLGRPTVDADAPLLQTLTQQFESSGYKMKAVVRGVLRSDAYRRANHLSAADRPGGEP
jgi:hypothetical protein